MKNLTEKYKNAYKSFKKIYESNADNSFENEDYEDDIDSIISQINQELEENPLDVYKWSVYSPASKPDTITVEVYRDIDDDDGRRTIYSRLKDMKRRIPGLDKHRFTIKTFLVSLSSYEDEVVLYSWFS